MDIEEAYKFLGLDNSVDVQTLRNEAFELYKKYFDEKDMEKVVKLETAVKIVYDDIKTRTEEESSKENTSETLEFEEQPSNNPDEKSENETYEFYEHLYDYPNEKTTTNTSKSGISFETMINNEIKLNKAKLFIADHLSSLIKQLDVIYDLEHLRKFIADNRIDQVIEAGFQDNKNKKHK